MITRRPLKIRIYEQGTDALRLCDLYWFEENSVLEYPNDTEAHVMLFTGYQDNTGSDIYEGDLVTWQYDISPWEVFWGDWAIWPDESARCETWMIRNVKHPMFFPLGSICPSDYTTVCGNIYNLPIQDCS